MQICITRLARWPMGLFASKRYLKKRGEPEPGTAFAGHDVVNTPHASAP
ncbi:hypothetical protein [Trinickia mobilis]